MTLKLNLPRERYEFETYRQQREGGDCFLKIFRREYAELIYGANVFANDPWELLRRRSAARDICRTVTPAKSALPVRPSTNHGFLGKIPGYAV